MGNSYYLNKVESEELLKAARRHSYKNQTEFARALNKAGYGISLDCTRAYLNQVLKRRRGASSEFRKVVLNVLKNDPQIQFLNIKKQKREIAKEITARDQVEESLKKLFDNYYLRIYEVYKSSDLQGKVALITGLEELVRSD